MYLVFSKLLTALNSAYRWALVASWTILTSIRCDTWASLPADAPEGTLAFLPRLCGHGRFIAIKESARWAVLPGQAVISDNGPGDAGYSLTATGTSLVVLQSYTIPAGMRAVGEMWAIAGGATKSVHVSGTDAPNVRIGGVNMGSSNTTGAAAPSGSVWDTNHDFPTATSVMRRLGGGRNNDSNVAPTTGVANVANAATIELFVTPGAAGNVINVHHWSLRRVA